MREDMPTVVLLAGGRGTRLGPLADSVPKSLVEAGGEPFIAHQLRLLKAQGVKKVMLCVGHLGELVRQAVGDGADYGLSVEYRFDGPRPLGTAGAVKKALPDLGDGFFILYGDSFLPCDFEEIRSAFMDCGRPALMTVFRNENLWDRSNVEYEEGRILAYDKKRPTSRMRHIDYGLGVFRREAFRHVPSRRSYDLSDLYRKLLACGELAAHEVRERFYEVGSPAGLEAFRAYLAEARRVP